MSVFKISEADRNLILFVQSHHQTIMSGLISTIAKRLDYNVTEYTQFELSPDASQITITELDPEPNESTEAVKVA